MSTPILATKLYMPPPRPNMVRRPRLLERLNDGLRCKLTLVAAPAGFGKTALVSEWLTDCARPAAWLSLDAGDSDSARFLTYLVAALQTIAADIGAGVLAALQSPQPPHSDAVLTTLLNDIASTISDPFVLVLDDYHLMDSRPVDQALTFLLERLPPQMRLVIVTREDPQLPLARLRAGGHLMELRAADLRFTAAEAAAFLNQVMGLSLSAEDIAALETRTEGWVAGLQLAAISLQGHPDVAEFITSFTGSHHFVMDYLVEEVLDRQPKSVQTFLLRTSILDRLCGPLCDAVALDPSINGQATLESLEHANLFIVPLDNERRWYRYHQLFADLLRQRLQATTLSSKGDEKNLIPELHRRASLWYEDHDLEVEAFHHAAVARDIDRAARLVEGKRMPLHLRGAVAPVLQWLASLPKAELDARPSLWVVYASAALLAGHNTAVEQKLQAAEAAVQGSSQDATTRDLVGRIAALRATLAVIQRDAGTILAQSRRALEYLRPDDLPNRTAATWTLGYAYQLGGNRAAASRTYTDVIAIGMSFGESIYTIAATLSLGQIQETNNQLSLAAESYRRVLQLAGDPPQPIACEAHLGLARICYQRNDLEAAERHGRQCVQLMRLIDSIDTVASSALVLARLKLVRGDAADASAILDEAAEYLRQHHFVHLMSDVAAAQALVLLHRGYLAAAAELAQTYQLPLSQARVHLAQGNASSALEALKTWRWQVEAKGWADEQLNVLALQAVALQAHGEEEEAVQALGDALALAAPGRFIRVFINEGPPMARLLSAAAARGIMPDYVGTLLAAFDAEKQKREGSAHRPPTAPGASAAPATPTATPTQPLIDPLSPREVEVLQLVAQGLSNQEISERLFLAVSTVKGHNQKIFDKLQVQRRTEAVARARELGLL